MKANELSEPTFFTLTSDDLGLMISIFESFNLGDFTTIDRPTRLS